MSDVAELRRLVEVFKGEAGAAWSQDIAEHVDAALDAVDQLVRGEISAEDAQITVERRLRAGTWLAAARAERWIHKFAGTLGEIVLQLAAKLIENLAERAIDG